MRPTCPLLLLALAISACSPPADDTGPDGHDDTGSTTPDLSTTRAANDRDHPWLARKMIDAATERVLVIEYVIYNDGLVADLLEAMVDARERGVEVRVLADEEADETASAVRWLEDRGVEARLDSGGTTSHNKLIIADDLTLVGSHNFSSSALGWNREASVLVVEPEATSFYERYFRSMWEDSDVDPDLTAVAVDGVVPLKNRDVVPALEACIQGARDRIRMVMYAVSWSDDYPDSDVNRLVEALVARKAAGVDVEVLLDDSEWIADNHINDDAVDVLRAGGVEVRLAPSDETTHAKALLCDDTVVVGDANWSYSSFSLYNGTSVQVTRPDVAAQYTEWMDRRWEAGTSAR